MSDLLSHTDKLIQSRQLFKRRERILIAVSGGVDSVVLLHMLHALSPKYGWRLVVAHLNHQFRGRSSDADEGMVRRTAEKLGVPILVERADVRAFARAHKLSLEMAARRVRHDFLARIAAQKKISTIALAHHADDQLELFFLRLLRGSGGEGLAGMKWRNPSPSDSQIQLVRPLLDQPKSALAEFAAQKKIRFREDATNALLDIQRNRIRHELLPLLRRSYQPALNKTVLRTMDIIGAEAQFVTEQAAEWLQQKRRRPFQELPMAVQRRCLQLQLLQLGIAGDYELVEQLRTAVDCPVAVSGAKRGDSRFVVRNSMGLVHLKQPPGGDFNGEQTRVALDARVGKVVFAGMRICWQIDPRKFLALRKPTIGRESFDAERVGSQIVLRHWQPGDRFQPIGMAFSVKLQDFFTNQKVARGRRHQLIVAATASGEVFWVEGMRISERFKLTAGSIRRLQWRWQRV